MPEPGRHESLVEDHFGCCETCFDVAERPLRNRLAFGQLALARRREILRGPLERPKVDPLIRDIAVAARVRAAREQALQRVDCERQLFVRDFNLLERVARELFGVGRNRQYRVPNEQRLVRENSLLRRRGSLDLVGRQHTVDTGHRERSARIDVRHASVRHGARQHLQEHHAVDAEILRVFGFTGHLCVDVGRREVLAKQFVGHMSSRKWNCSTRRRPSHDTPRGPPGRSVTDD
jgi:hypothetical protein